MNKKAAKIEVEKCPICGCMIFTISGNQVDKDGGWGDGCICQCGWTKTCNGHLKPDELDYPNHMSINQAKQRYQAGLPLTPDYDNFIDMINYWGEVVFFYRGIKYGVIWDCDYKLNLYVMGGDTVCRFSTLEEFAAKANINGVLLKDLWVDVKNADWMDE